MARFILINESTRCAKPVTPDQIRQMIDIRTNPAGGYTDVDQCMAMITNPEGGTFRPFPFKDRYGNTYTIHVEGRLDFASTLKFREAGHQCGPLCLIPDKEKRLIRLVTR